MENLPQELQRTMNAIVKDKAAKISAELIVDIACDVLNVNRLDIESEIRDRGLVECRYVIAFLVDHHLHLSYSKIGNMIGSRHRTTVRYALQKCEDLKDDPIFKIKLEQVKNRLEVLCG